MRLDLVPDSPNAPVLTTTPIAGDSPGTHRRLCDAPAAFHVSHKRTDEGHSRAGQELRPCLIPRLLPRLLLEKETLDNGNTCGAHGVRH
jgi:hypothetical protein